jgi:hypothetical protein
MWKKSVVSREMVMRESRSRLAFEDIRHALDIEKAEHGTYKNNPYKSLETMQGFSLFCQGIAHERNSGWVKKDFRLRFKNFITNRV